MFVILVFYTLILGTSVFMTLFIRQRSPLIHELPQLPKFCRSSPFAVTLSVTTTCVATADVLRCVRFSVDIEDWWLIFSVVNYSTNWPNVVLGICCGDTISVIFFLVMRKLGIARHQLFYSGSLTAPQQMCQPLEQHDDTAVN